VRLNFQDPPFGGYLKIQVEPSLPPACRQAGLAGLSVRQAEIPPTAEGIYPTALLQYLRLEFISGCIPVIFRT